MVVPVLNEAQRRKWDPSDDGLFYAEPRLVHDLDGAFRALLTRLYRERIPAGAVVLDLMYSWVSHQPDDVAYASVFCHGLNVKELSANPRLHRHWVQKLNVDQRLPLESDSVDATLIVAFSNRMFFTKAPQVWTDGSDRDHLAPPCSPKPPAPRACPG